jgi:hypothetical protein
MRRFRERIIRNAEIGFYTKPTETESTINDNLTAINILSFSVSHCVISYYIRFKRSQTYVSSWSD